MNFKKLYRASVLTAAVLLLLYFAYTIVDSNTDSEHIRATLDAQSTELAPIFNRPTITPYPD